MLIKIVLGVPTLKRAFKLIAVKADLNFSNYKLLWYSKSKSFFNL